MADILNLRCDAWLLPTDSRVRIEQHWPQAHPELESITAASASPEFQNGTVLAEPVRPWDPAEPLPIVSAVPDDGGWGVVVVAERLARDDVAPSVEDLPRSFGGGTPTKLLPARSIVQAQVQAYPASCP